MVSFDKLSHPYPIKRQATYGRNGMVATSQATAAQAGLEILKKGGNAIDAAIATAACLTVVEPTSNGIGGDAFALVWTEGKLHGLNASGCAPKNISTEKVKAAGYEEMPDYGWTPVTVPGAPSAWKALSERFGKLPLTEVLEPAIRYAEEGYAIPANLSRLWKSAYDTFKKELKGEAFDEWFRVFAPDGHAPKAGEIWSSQDHANTLRSIAETNAESFYRGELADKIVAASEANGGYFVKEDLAECYAEWVDPISVNYRGYDVWEIPPNGQGIIALQALKILEGFDLTERDTVDSMHKQIESTKLAFTDALQHVTDSKHMKHTVEEILSDAYAEHRRSLISEEAILPVAGKPFGSGTVYLCTADNEGNMVSFIQSNYKGFGSGIVVPGTGIAMQNRGKDFKFDEEHVNVLKGGKRTYHTIIPGFLTKGDQPVGPFGLMGGYMQPQGHLQLVVNTIDFKLNPQQAIDAPRWRWDYGKHVEVEERFHHHLADGLHQKGHDIQIALDPNGFGRGQIIWRDPETGVLVGGTESRTDGAVVAW